MELTTFEELESAVAQTRDSLPLLLHVDNPD
jgi:hypothetical protein